LSQQRRVPHMEIGFDGDGIASAEAAAHH